MSIKKITPTIRNTDSQYERENRSIARIFNSQPLVNGILLNNISLSTSTTLVPHRLERPYLGFIITKLTSAGTVFLDTTVAHRIQDVIPLQASGNLLVDIWVF